MIALPLLTDAAQSMADSPFTTAVAYAAQVLPGKDLDHLRFFRTTRGLSGYPAPGVLVAEEIGSDMPRHTAECAAVTFDVVVPTALRGCGVFVMSVYDYYPDLCSIALDAFCVAYPVSALCRGCPD